MTYISRRAALAGVAGLALSVTARASLAADAVVRVGYQKYGTLVLLKGKGILEKKLEPLGVTVKWSEFAAGPQMLEALNAGAIDIGQTGEAPPIFAQAASDNLIYLASEPASPAGEAIIIPKDSPLKSVEELRGKTVGLNKGSNVHFLLVKALEKHGLAYSEIKTAFLPPADARAAFERGAIDAWAIWDPFFAAAEVSIGARPLTTAEGIVPNYQFYLGSRKFADANPAIIEALISAVDETNRWVEKDTTAAAETLAPLTGIPVAALTVALKRQNFGVAPLTEKVVADQQLIADTFLKLGLLPKPVNVAEAVRKPRA
ncbi:aliphatic sulfonates family ABC transporter, periplsmic ligand-binding protein [Methylocella silvestris BL2]|uniref:Putative aliphatic sulfonates-binding protein n=1 Tax=Methylocella silvestris (strain DSM 15510 / CIP 108128 / LMG 27833 / NCIMB 13906 / BL2) TaxID=395965 RepID=B8ER00_METSB|nr:sulfonate ABC transporter substrate-binding protein [Methylocella silvestris]ACK49745.1 aliphatic sulfonates family ABC transporter, periplsmic ligand-binding protein [Methylocella silvestris BL2]